MMSSVGEQITYDKVKHLLDNNGIQSVKRLSLNSVSDKFAGKALHSHRPSQSAGGFASNCVHAANEFKSGVDNFVLR